MPLRGRRIENFLKIWWLVASGVGDIWVSSTGFQKNDISWPQQPRTEIVLISVKNWLFDDPFPQKGAVLVILVPGMTQPLESVMFLMKWGCRGSWIQLYFDGLKKKLYLVDSWKIILKFTTFFVRGCWDQLISFFWKLVDETQMFATPEATNHHSSRKFSILLPLRAF